MGDSRTEMSNSCGVEMTSSSQINKETSKRPEYVVFSETDARIRKDVKQLIEEIEHKITQVSLRSATYDELGRLLDLLPNVELTNDDNIISMAELAASILISQLELEHQALKEGKSSTLNSIPGGLNDWAQKIFFRSTSSNVALAKRIRKKIAKEIRIYQNPLAAVLSAGGSPAAQLISGLTWFTIIFLMFIGLGAFSIFLMKEKVESTGEAYNLGFDQGYQLGNDQRPDEPEPDNVPQFNEQIKFNVLRNQSVESSRILVDASGQPKAGIVKHLDTTDLLVETLAGRREGRDDFLFSSREMSGIYLVIFAGGLGSIVSVMIRLRSLDSQSRSQSVIPFFVGFFKPFIGTAFSLFVIALLEAKVVVIPAFELDSDLKKYLYFVVAFTAGFSEVLVPDLLSKTERSIAKDK